MGPGFSNGLGDSLAALIVTVALAGTLLGIGCNAGCSYVRRHVDVNVEWKP